MIIRLFQTTQVLLAPFQPILRAETSMQKQEVMSNSFRIALAIAIVGKLSQQYQQQQQQLENRLSNTNTNTNSDKKGNSNSSFNTIAHVCILLPIHWLNRQSWEITSAVTIKYYTALERQFSKKTIAGQHLHLIGVQILKDNWY